MLQKFLFKQMMKSQLGDMPKDQQERILEVVDKNPELFQKIAKEIKEETSAGKDQMAAAMSVMRRHQQELQQALKD